MLLRPLTLQAPRGSVAADEIREGIDALIADRADDMPVEFPADVLAAAEEAAGRAADEDRADRTDIPFITLDPASSTDLDQAMHLSRTAGGYRVLYAIADVPWFVPLHGPIDTEARRRGETVYLPDRRIPLHPEVLSEGAASLLPEQPTPAFVWDLQLDERGEVREVGLERAIVRSVAKLAYDEVQQQLDAGTADEMMLLLQEIGQLRAQLESERGGASLNVPEQEVEADGDHVRLTWRQPNPIEDANAQISLMTGMAAASVMLEHGAGILRTMPPAQDQAVARFRRQTEALGEPWPTAQRYGDYLRSLDWRNPSHLALLNQATSLFRGAGYHAFTSAEQIPEDPAQAAIAAPYAHTTAPLRRLVDRFVLLICHHHLTGTTPPAELLAALAEIPEAMQSAGSRVGQLEREAIDLVEMLALRAWVGETFPAAVIERREASTNSDGNGGAPTRVEVQLIDPPVTAWVPLDAQMGQVVRVRLENVDVAERSVRFVAAGESEPTTEDAEPTTEGEGAP